MKIGVDIHGVLSDKDNIKSIINKLVGDGHEIYVISAAPVIDMMQELKLVYEYDLKLFKGFYSIAEHLYHQIDSNEITNAYQDSKQRWYFEPEEMWWKSKAEICEKFQIDVMIDDKVEYQQGYLEERLLLYPIKDNETIDLFLSDCLYKKEK